MSNPVQNIEVFFKDIELLIEKQEKVGKMSILSLFKERYENTHSDVLNFFLNPNEAHQHKDEYLKLFLKEVGFENLAQLDLTNVVITREYSLKNERRIDLLIKIDYCTCIIIENKVDATDLKDQLSDYYKGMEKLGFKNIYILYLTLDGKSADENSQGNLKEKFEELQNEGKYVNISYQNHILHWLKELSFKSTEHTLRSSIEQYIYLIEILTIQTDEGIAMKKDMIKAIEKYDIAQNISEFTIVRDILNAYIYMEVIKNIYQQVLAVETDMNKIILSADKNTFATIEELQEYIILKTTDVANPDCRIGIEINGDTKLLIQRWAKGDTKTIECIIELVSNIRITDDGILAKVEELINDKKYFNKIKDYKNNTKSQDLFRGAIKIDSVQAEMLALYPSLKEIFTPSS